MPNKKIEMESNKKKILLVAYYFPPIGGGGVQRALKMAKYLPEFGYEVHVLTVDPAYHATRDESLLAEIPTHGVVIHRVAEPQGIVEKLKRTLRPTETPTPTGSDTQTIQKSVSVRPQAGGLKAKLFKLAKKAKTLALIPDDQIVWRKPAVAEGIRLLKTHRFDAIVSTSGPYTNHLVAQVLTRIARRNARKATRLWKAGSDQSRYSAPKWIADFRDPWTQNMHRSGIPWRERMEEQMERSVHKFADATLTVTQSFADNFAAKYAKEINRVEVIHNGFDPADYATLQRTRSDNDKCVMMYAGIFYKERNPRLLLQAIHDLIGEGKIDRDKLHIKFAGVLDYPGYSENRDEIARLNLTDLVEAPGNLPHKQALAEMKNSDILLLIADTAPDSGAYIPGKLFEYMAIGNPILALSMEGESTRIIERFELGVVANPTNLAAIKQAILALYTNWLSGTVPSKSADDASTLPYQRREQARLLAELIDNL